MKKIISLIIAMAMIMTALPMSFVYAEGEGAMTFTVNPVAQSNIGDIAIYSDAEYTTEAANDLVSANTQQNPSPVGIVRSTLPGLVNLGFGGEYLSIKGYTKDTQISYDLTDAIVVPEDGYYKMNYAIGGHTSYSYVSKVMLQFAPADNTTQKELVTSYVPEDWSISTAATNPARVGYGARHGECVWSVTEEIVKLKAGTYKATFTIGGRGADKFSNNHNLLLSPMQFTKVTDFEKIAKSGKTTIEYENYSHYGESHNADVANASGGTAAMAYYGKPIASPEAAIMIPVTVEEAGIYNFETVLAKGISNTTTVYVDGEKIAATTDAGIAMDVNLKNDTNYPLYKYNGEVTLSKGDHEIYVTVGKGSLQRFAADYISFENTNKPLSFTVNPVAASDIGNISIFEDEAHTTAAANDVATAHSSYTPAKGITRSTFSGLTNLGYGSEFLSVKGYTDSNKLPFALTNSIIVPKTGYYKMSYAIGGNTSYASNSGYRLEFAPKSAPDQKEIVTEYIFEEWSNNGAKNSQYSLVGWGCREGEGAWSVTEEIVKLEEGEYNAFFTIFGNQSKAKYQITLSPIQFTEVTEYQEISNTEKTIIEYEDYSHYGEKFNTDVEGTSGGSAAMANYSWPVGATSARVVIPVTVKETGMYDFETVLAQYSEESVPTKVYIDGELVAENAKGVGEALNVKLNNNAAKELYKHTGTVTLAAGTHEIMAVATDGSNLRFGMDYIAFEKSNAQAKFTVTPVAASNIGDVAIYEDAEYTTPATIDITNTHTADPIPKGIYKSAEKDLVALGYGNEYLSVLGNIQTTKFSYDLADTIIVPKTGYYKMRYAIGGDTGYSRTSNVKLEFAPKSNLTQKTLVTAYSHEAWSNTSSGTDNPTRVGYGSINNRIVWSNEEEYAYLEAGEYVATFTVYGGGSASASNAYNLLMSPMEFAEATEFEEISKTEKTTIEFEDYTHYGNALATVANASGSAAIGYYGVTIASPAISYIIPVTVTEEARYSFETVLAKGGDTGPTTIYLDGEKLVASSDEGTSMECNFNDNKGYPMYKFTGEVALSEGTHEIKVTNSANLLRTAADYISFEKAPALTSYTISPTAASNIDEIDWYADAEKTTPVTVDLSTLVDNYTAPTGVTKLTFDNLRKKGFGDNYLSIRNVFADDVVSFTLDDTLTIEATDYYNVSYAIGGNTGYAFDGISVTLQDVNDPTKENVITRYIPEDYSNDNTNVGAGHGALNNQNVYSNDFNEIAKIEEGEYKVTFTIYKRAGDDTYTHLLTLSDIHLDATEPANIPAEAKVVFEVEDYTHYGASLNQQEGGVADMSGNGIAWTHYGTPRGNVPVLINIPVNVEEEADYVLETYMARSTAGSTYIYVDGEQIVHNYTGGILTGKTLHTDGNYAMATYKEKIHLTEGEHLITVSGSTAGSLLRFAVDYVSLEKYYENHVTQSATTRIEIEDYADKFAAAYGETEIEEGLASYANPTQPVAKIMFTDAGKNFSGNYAMMGKKETEEAKTFSVPVTIKESGYYNAKYRIGGTGDINTFAWLKAALIDEGGNSFSLSDAMYRATATEASIATQVRINDGNGRYTWQITSAPVYIPAGTYDLTFTINGTTFVFDYVDIMPFTDFVQVGEKIEYDFINMATHSNDLASEGTYQQSSWAFGENAKEKIEYPLTITEAGYYDMEAVMNYSSGDNTTRIKIMVDDSVVYDNRKSATDLSVVDEEGNRSFHDRYFPMHHYEGGKVYLEEGEHKLVLDMSATNEKFKYVYKFGIDYVKLTKSQDEMSMDGNEVVIKVDYGKAVSGQAYMAFYKGDKLVEVKEAGTVNTTAEASIAEVGAEQPSEDYDYIKLLVWGTNLLPSAFAIGFAK